MDLRRGFFFRGAAIAACILSAEARQGGAVERVNLAPSGAQTSGIVGAPAISGNGRFVAFASSATDLVPGDTNGVQDVFVRDRLLGTTERASVADQSGAQADGRSFHPSISDDGRFVAFTSLAANLAPNADQNGVHDIYLRDRASGRTRLVSVVAPGHAQAQDAASGMSYSPALSGDGRWIAFYSEAHDLVPPGADANGWYDAFVADLATGTIELASVASNGAQADFHSGSQGPEDPAANGISADGRFVVFLSNASNLVAGATSGLRTVYMRDRLAGTTDVAARTIGGAPSLHESGYPAISGDGSSIVFFSADPLLVPGDVDALFNFFVLDRVGGTIERIDTDSAGTPCGPTQGAGFGLTGRVTLSADGSRIAFAADCPNLAAGDNNAARDVFLHDRRERATHLVSRSLGGSSGNAVSTRTAISADGTHMAFQSGASDLVPGDTNASHDIFVAPLPWPATTFCAGDGSGTACPCGGQGSAGRGCPNSAAPSGARLGASGMASVAHDSLGFVASGLPPQAGTLLLQGTAMVSGGQGAVFGDGLRCAGGAVVRLAARPADLTGLALFGTGVQSDPRISVQGQVPAGGATRIYQLYYRNAASYCTASTFNLSNALALDWAP